MEEGGQRDHELNKAGHDLDERIDHAIVPVKSWLDRPEIGPDSEADSVNRRLSQPVLCMIAGSDDHTGLPEAASGIVARDEAMAQLDQILSGHGLPPIPYDPATDSMELCYEPSDATGHRYYGFAPLGADLSYEREAVPFDVWQVKVNGIVVYTTA
jgi:hypothetical protein